MSEHNTVTVTIGLFSYNIKCAKDKVDLVKNIAVKLNDKNNLLKQLKPNYTKEQISTMAALNVILENTNSLAPEKNIDSNEDLVKIQKLNSLIESEIF
jgi:cell division protein ZapA (FtsZ GTPase activity inhibitor)